MSSSIFSRTCKSKTATQNLLMAMRNDKFDFVYLSSGTLGVDVVFYSMVLCSIVDYIFSSSFT